MFSPLPVYDRNLANSMFDALRSQARNSLIWAKLFRREIRLASFSDQSRSNVNRKFPGIQEIPIENIVGTLGREDDFDYKFRPLRPHLRERWVDVYLSFEAETWPPILVHQVDEKYFVEDGHHRISVARAVGMAFIQAEIWEYATCPVTAKFNQPQRCCATACLREAYPA